jgi:hypothetical protein
MAFLPPVSITTLCIMGYERPWLWRRNKRKPQSM